MGSTRCLRNDRFPLIRHITAKNETAIAIGASPRLLLWNHKRRGYLSVGESGSLVLIIVLMILAFAASFWLRNFLTKRAVLKVVKIFYQHNALGMNGAKTQRELGLERPDFVARMMKPRDYKQTALQLLVKEDVIRVTEGKLYLVEGKLDPKYRMGSNV